MFAPMPDRSSIADLIKNSTPVDTEDRELKEARKELARLKRLNIDQQIQTKFGALTLYMDFFIEWKVAQAQKRIAFSWQWNKLKFSSVQIFEEHDGTTLCPIMDFKEFSALLIIAYKYY